MSLMTKYKALLELANQLQLRELEIEERSGKLVIKGKSPYGLEKDLFWDKLKSYEGWEAEVSADLRVENTDLFGIWTVKPGDSLSKIAKSAYDDAKLYMRIFEANKDQLKDPDKIHPGQKLKLPKP